MTAVCDFCWRYCAIEAGQRGFCGIREQRKEDIVTVNYGKLLAASVEPLEKKPLYHFLPGTKTLSVALFGCNYRCAFCQNHDLSQKDSPLYPAPWKHYDDGVDTSPLQLVHRMKECKVSTMTYTYSEPVVWQDYMLDTARLVKEEDGRNCMITNGSFSTAAQKRIFPLIDGYNIDVKGDEEFYRKYCKASLRPVLDTLEAVCALPGKIVEVTTLVIEEIHDIDDILWLGHRLKDAGVSVWHLSRFFPHYKMDSWSATSERFLARAIEAAESCGIPYIYAGNSGNEHYSKTRCPNCRTEIISRRGYYVHVEKELYEHLLLGKCTECGEAIYGMF